MSDEPRAPVPATWRAEDFVDLDQYNGVVEIDLFRGTKAPILVDARGYDQLAYLGDTTNPLAVEAVSAFEDAQGRAEAILDGGPRPSLVARAAEARRLQDAILAAICIRPHYCRRDKLVQGKPPPGQFWYGSFTPDQRRELCDFFYNGADAVKPFRPSGASHAPAVPASDGVPPAPERDPDSAGAGVPALVAGRGGAAAGEPPPGPGAGGGGAPDGPFLDTGNGHGG